MMTYFDNGSIDTDPEDANQEYRINMFVLLEYIDRNYY